MIDLSALKPLELPKKEVEITVAGEKQKVTITPFGGRGEVALREFDFECVGCAEKLKVLAMVYGAKMSETQAEYLLENDPNAALELAGEIWMFQKEYTEKIKAEREDAKKKSGEKSQEMNIQN